MRILICGSRHWTDKFIINVTMRGLIGWYGTFTLIHGAAPGADSIAGEFGDYLGLPVEPYPADWDRYGRSAGPIRNQQMLDEGNPDLVIGFTNDIDKSKGTRDMISRAAEAKVPYYVIGTNPYFTYGGDDDHDF